MKIPKGSYIVEIGEICQIINGSTPSTSIEDYWNGDIVWVTPKDLGKLKGKTINTSERKISKEGYNSANLTIVPTGSIILSTRAPIGYVAIAKTRLCFNQGCKALIPNKTINGDFLYYFLVYSKSVLELFGSGAIFKELSTINLSKIKLLLPPLAEQERIVKIIEEKIKSVETIRKAIQEQLKETNIMLDAYIRTIYNSQKQTVKIGEIARINPSIKEMKIKKDNIEVSFVPMTAVDANTGIIEKPETRKLSEVRKGYTYFEDNDIIFAKIIPCMQNGKHAIAKNLVNGIGFGSTEFHVIRPSTEVLPEWIHYFLRQSSYLYQAENYMQGAVGQQRLPDDYLYDTIIPLPPIDEQKKHISFLQQKQDKLGRANKLLAEQAANIDALPSSILRQAFNGEL